MISNFFARAVIRHEMRIADKPRHRRNKAEQIDDVNDNRCISLNVRFDVLPVFLVNDGNSGPSPDPALDLALNPPASAS